MEKVLATFRVVSGVETVLIEAAKITMLSCMRAIVIDMER